jgi:hypothetical protein
MSRWLHGFKDGKERQFLATSLSSTSERGLSAAGGGV